jgi:Fe2+ or Zn2+ uptake regulation protein
VNHWEQHLIQAGYRITVPRRTVMDVLMATRLPLSPQEIHRQGAASYPSLGQVTVYRALALFQELGLVRRVHFDGGCRGYLPTSPGHRHAIICTSCGRAEEFAGGDDLRALVAQVEVVTDYQVNGHLLQLSGLCPDCSNGRS